ncbi:NAD(P)H-dependent oxidoreductase subunit E [Gudongella sp. DL1XJH-153]|uniref:NADH-quinone oxidoreductase subunit NuoE family protein n=1 Tax=Gudongella sp. DL1XJH-153 TaxID=3409804 RepID=UPI003BB496C0
MEFKFDKEENKEQIVAFMRFLDSKKNTPGPLMPSLQHAQEVFGYLPKEVLEIISKELSIPMAEIYGVATFYSQFSFVPTGKNKISVCMGTACYVKGAQSILEEIESQLGIESGETTVDEVFSIAAARCVGDCSIAPVILVNEDVYAKVKKDDITEILAKYN